MTAALECNHCNRNIVYGTAKRCFCCDQSICVFCMNKMAKLMITTARHTEDPLEEIYRLVVQARKSRSTYGALAFVYNYIDKAKEERFLLQERIKELEAKVQIGEIKSDS